MRKTGDKDTLEAVYGENAVVHMLSETWRSFNRHLQTKYLDHMIVSDVVHSIGSDWSPWFAKLVDQSEEIYPSLVVGETISESFETSDINLVMAKMKLVLRHLI